MLERCWLHGVRAAASPRACNTARLASHEGREAVCQWSVAHLRLDEVLAQEGELLGRELDRLRGRNQRVGVGLCERAAQRGVKAESHTLTLAAH